MMSMLRSPWMVALVGTLSYLLTTIGLWRVPPLPRPAPPTAVAAAAAMDFSRLSDQEIDQLVANLKEKKQSLEEREKRCQQWETRLRAEHAELQHLMDRIDQVRTQVDQAVARVEAKDAASNARLQQQEAAHWKRMAKVYAGLSPQTAGAILKEMDDEQLLKLMSGLKDQELITLLQYLASRGPEDAKRAAALTQRLGLSAAAPP